MTQAMQLPVQPGEPAPDFVVPAVQSDRTISLDDYRGRAPLLLGLFRGLYCPFCRRAVAQMAASSEHLKALGVESLAIVGTELDNARLYFKFRSTRMTLGADAQLTTHRAYRVPQPQPTGELMEMVEKIRINPNGELPEPLPIPQAGAALDKRDGYQPTAVDQRDADATFTLMNGQFLIDRDGVVRWVYIECAKEGLAGVGLAPDTEELLTAARTVTVGTRT
jgi:peroxiredoxin